MMGITDNRDRDDIHRGYTSVTLLRNVKSSDFRTQELGAVVIVDVCPAVIIYLGHLVINFFKELVLILHLVEAYDHFILFWVKL